MLYNGRGEWKKLLIIFNVFNENERMILSMKKNDRWMDSIKKQKNNYINKLNYFSS